MPTSLTQVTAGTPISAAAMQDYASDIEYFINEGMASGDIQTSSSWVRSTHIYRPEFNTVLCPRVRFVSGEVHWRHRGFGGRERGIHHAEVNAGGAANAAGQWVNVDGCNVSFAVPQAITESGDPAHRVLTRICWYTHEIGGDGTPNEGAGASQHCSDFAMHLDGQTKEATIRPLYTASGSNTISMWAVKQYSIMYPARITTAGEHHIGLKMRMYSRGIGSGGAHDHWRHIFIWGRSTVLSWFRL